MRHEVHYHDPKDTSTRAHVLHTERAAWNKMPHPTIANTSIDMVDWLKLLIATPALQAGTGWDQPSNHPAYPGKTILQVAVLEITRQNDVAARATLGV